MSSYSEMEARSSFSALQRVGQRVLGADRGAQAVGGQHHDGLLLAAGQRPVLQDIMVMAMVESSCFCHVSIFTKSCRFAADATSKMTSNSSASAASSNCW